MNHLTYSPPLHIYRASAGSGKTFLLASEYLCLLFESPQKYREILAVTFTNKATEEMKHRILGELLRLAKGEKTDYGEIIEDRFPALKDGNRLATQADTIYRTILHDYAKFSVSTIDSFVQQVIRSFAYEIGLDAGYELQLNQDIVKQELTDRLFELLQTNDELLEWIKSIALERIETGQSWDFRDELLKFSGEIFQERFARFENNMRNLDNPTTAFQVLKKKLQDQAAELEKPMLAWAEEANNILQQSGLQQDDFSHGKGGFINYFNKIRDKNFAPGARVLAALDNPDKWTSTKADADTKSKVKDIYPRINELLNKCVDLYREKNTEYQTARAVLQKLNNLSLLRILAEQLAGYRRDNNVLLISDTQQLLRELVKDNDAPFIYEKIGNRYQHFLLDEFQDTSTFQWDNFRPMVEQSVSTGQFSLVVGDVKQSIYRWRNGDWRLLQQQVKADIGTHNVKEDSLQENYRSRANIIQFNNYLFHRAPELLQDHFNAEMGTVEDAAILARLHGNDYFDIIRKAYADASQQMPASCKPGGIVDFRFFPKEDSQKSSSWKPAAEAWLCDLIDQLICDKKFQPEQITLLTRNNSDARKLISLLLQHQQRPDARTRYGLLSTDALLINASPAIQLLIAALRYLINEKDELSRAELVQANAIRLGLDINKPDWYRNSATHALSQLPEAFRTRKKYLLQTALYECVEELITIFSLDEYINEQAYTLAFRDLVNNFSSKGKPDIREFLQWWTEEGSQKALPLSSADNAIQVMTIHKSKGLAFDVVIIPYADWKLVSDKGMIWCNWEPDESGIEVVPVELNKNLAHTGFAYDYFEEQLMSRMDALNMLYVALTRTRQAMYLLAPQPAEKKDADNGMSTIGDLIYQAVKQTPVDLPSGITDFSAVFESGVLLVDGAVQGGESGNKNKDLLKISTQLTNAALLKDLREPSGGELILRLAENDQQKVGQLAHLLLSRIKNITELDQELAKMQLEGQITHQHLETVKDSVSRALQHEQLSAWFGADYKAVNEKSILLPGGSVRRPDKVLMADDETILLDFKFTQEASVSHGKQLQQYQDLLVQMGYPAVRSFVYYGYNHSLVPLAQLASKQGDLFG
ncbi:hypothetical protein BC349_17345 [Flavihumibacter stibioxidans]|uniref:DNA 3'-5' helicase n=2 Tax=Flavihumibacter stibioxidans TaxID=1834163 RepID=A0ABR7MCR6_9BACT|nr:hypothetical protein [Flavihumibacter stibioxidans]